MAAVSTKENNGKGARKLLMRRVTVIVGFFAALCVVVEILRSVFVPWLVPSSRNSSSSSNNLQLHRLRSLLSMKNHKKSKGNAFASFERSQEEVWQDILDAKVHLVALDFRPEEMEEALRQETLRQRFHAQDDASANTEQTLAYGGVYGIFCRVDWQKHKTDPSSVPMFRDVEAQSEDCNLKSTPIAFADLIPAVRKHDAKIKAQRAASPKVLDMGGVVFHESRCGSTLVANLLSAVNPAGHRVYSESPPPITALLRVCGEEFTACTEETAAAVLRDTMYMMARSDDPNEQRVFFKIQSIGSRAISVFQKAFPETPWLFVYREPVQVMQSHLANGPRSANCLRYQKRFATQALQELVHHRQPDVGNPQRLSYEMYCAAHLATLTESALQALDAEQEGLGRPVSYGDLPDRLYHDIFPYHFGIPVDDAAVARMQQTAGQYSKGRASKQGSFTSDSEAKEQSATREVKDAAAVYLTPSYAALEERAQQAARREEHRPWHEHQNDDKYAKDDDVVNPTDDVQQDDVVAVEHRLL